MAEAQPTRITWTDERLDDMSKRVDDGFNRVDARFDSIDRRFDAVDRRFDSLEARFDARFDAMQQTMIRVGGGMIATMAVGFISVAIAAS